MARRTTWEDDLVNLGVSSGSQGSTDLTVGLTADEKAGRTVTRLIGELGLASSTVAGAWGVQAVDIGIAIIDGDAFAAGALPDPNPS